MSSSRKTLTTKKRDMMRQQASQHSRQFGYPTQDLDQYMGRARHASTTKRRKASVLNFLPFVLYFPWHTCVTLSNWKIIEETGHGKIGAGVIKSEPCDSVYLSDFDASKYHVFVDANANCNCKRTKYTVVMQIYMIMVQLKWSQMFMKIRLRKRQKN